MSLSIRAVFAVVLWAAALLPVLLYVVHLSSPVAAVQVSLALGATVRNVLFYGAIAALLGIVVYPPFLPTLKIAFRRVKRRISTDLSALYEAQSRLEHLDTAADRLTAGRILLQQDRVRPAIEHLARAVELDPEHAATRYQLGLALGRAGDLPAATEQLRKVCEIDKGHAFGAGQLELGIVLERSGDNDGAIEVLEGHERDFGPNRRNMYHRALAHARRGERERSLEVLRATAAPPEADRKLTLEEELLRARARVALMRGGRLV